MKRIHFIAIGGAAMHNLAIALKRKGHNVSGSDDQIFDPSKGRLEREGLLPKTMGWQPENITSEIEVIILGMHARVDNPELIRAQELGIQIMSYPEFIYHETREKKRIVIAGSHGKTSITAMVLHVLQKSKIEFDYMVGAQLEGFDCMVQLSDAPIIVLEGDEYLSSPIDRRPKFHWYQPHIAIITGISWDHINVFPTFENYIEQFELFINELAEDASLIYFNGDPTLKRIVQSNSKNISTVPYETPDYSVESGCSIIKHQDQQYQLKIIGKHNMQNVKGAQLICEALGISGNDFFHYIQSFSGAARRMELVQENPDTSVFKDFAHAPSKLKATTAALKEFYPHRKLVACMELHTFSSLNADFLDQYNESMDAADEAIIYFNPDVVEKKKLSPLSPEKVKESFGNENALIYTDS